MQVSSEKRTEKRVGVPCSVSLGSAMVVFYFLRRLDIDHRMKSNGEMVTRHLKQWRSLTISSDLAATLPQPLALIAAMQRSAFWSIGCIWLRSARRSAKCAMIFLASRNPSPCCSLKCHMSVVGGLAWRCQSAKFPHGRSPGDLRTSHPHHYRDQRSSRCKPLLCALRVLLRRLWNTSGLAA